MANTNMEHGEIILYQPDNTIKLEVRIENETVWLTQAQIVNLFQSSKANISEHLLLFLHHHQTTQQSLLSDKHHSSAEP